MVPPARAHICGHASRDIPPHSGMGATSPVPLESCRRSSEKNALERCAIRRLAVRGQYELDRQVEQRAEALDEIVARHVLAIADPDVQSVAEVGERVAGDDRVDRRQPEDEVVVLAARVRGDAERPRSGTVKVSLAFAGA